MNHQHLSAALALASMTSLSATAGEGFHVEEAPGTESELLATLHDPDTGAAMAGLGAKDALTYARTTPPWTLSVGPAYRHMGDGTEYRGGTRSRFLSIPSFVGTDSLYVPAIGQDGTVGDREYDNGYVSMDAATATDGSTWYWGHDSDTQVVGGNLVFNATGSKSIRSNQADIIDPLHETKDQDAVRPHIQLHFENPGRSWRGFKLGFGLSAGQIPIDHGVRYADYLHVQVRDDYRVDWTDTYGLQDVVPPLAPYDGTLSGPGPVIDNIPTTRESVDVLINTDTALFTNLVTSRFHGSLFTVGLGPTLAVRHGELDFRIAGGPTLSILNWSASQREVNTLTTSGGGSVTGVTTYRDWNDNTSGNMLVPGLFGQAELVWQYDEEWFASVLGRLDVAASPKLDVGPSSYEIDPSGYTVGFQIGRSF